MGIPGEGAAKAWRNDIKSVASFLNNTHPKHYRIFNLSGEQYNYSYFYSVKEFGWPDHQYAIFETSFQCSVLILTAISVRHH